MTTELARLPIRAPVIDALYVDAMLLADEARAYFEDTGRIEREALDPLIRVGFSCESLKFTTRLMHVIAWLLDQRALLAGELTVRQALAPDRRLGDGPALDADLIAALPSRAQALIAASAALHLRVARLDNAQVQPPAAASPVHLLHDRLLRGL